MKHRFPVYRQGTITQANISIAQMDASLDTPEKLAAHIIGYTSCVKQRHIRRAERLLKTRTK